MSRCWSLAIAFVACSRAGDERATRQWQESPPPPAQVVPVGLSIAVEVDGAAKPPITAEQLTATKPDFVDTERRAWLIRTLVADTATGSMIEAASPSGVSLKLALSTADGLEPVLFLTRRGEFMVSTIDPKDPFPPYHGQGGRLHRAGDSMPHVGPVAKLSITRPK